MHWLMLSVAEAFVTENLFATMAEPLRLLCAATIAPPSALLERAIGAGDVALRSSYPFNQSRSQHMSEYVRTVAFVMGVLRAGRFDERAPSAIARLVYDHGTVSTLMGSLDPAWNRDAPAMPTVFARADVLAQ